ncbi:ComF family protein [Prolixibacter sp. SD074]|jgi:ComF family protein|uniref:ComF family protein n=1 Tax=Prolixibacter sp. SD074 TaxID=2652391 RepID=UPI00127514AB|nr:ComF family protein [Prolixibacter sp. SD074]GET30358.1 amidophosphoribosyltransferase [Prolixibacter sp. SD074]
MSVVYDFISLFFPRLCAGCGEPLVHGEEGICIRCLADLPRTGFARFADNKVAQVFWGRVPLEYAVSLCYFEKGSRLQHMFHRMKYRREPGVGKVLGRELGLELFSSPMFETLDAVIPVPLHPKKQKKRGYNQSEYIANGISEAINIPVITDALIRNVHTSSQTRKSRYNRWENVEGIFQAIKPEKLENLHLLVVDDVVTTGATLEACCVPLLKIPGVRVSIATLACA